MSPSTTSGIDRSNLAEMPDIARLHSEFGEAIRSVETDAAGEPVVYIDAARNFEILKHLRDASGYDMLKDVTALDLGGGRPVQLVYQLWSTSDSNPLRVKAEVPHDRPKVQSAYGIWRASNWLEREVYDMFGITFEGHPDPRRMLMPENYEEGYPLRKDFPLRGRFTRAEQTRRALARDLEDIYSVDELSVAEGTRSLAARLSQTPGVDAEAVGGAPELQTKNMILNIGPQHPATHGVLRIVCELDGETIVKCTPHIGYLHSGFEKLGEYRTWNQNIPLTDRMEYLAPMMYNIGYALAVEELLGLEITPRCKVIRVICSELNRILGHLIWIGTTAIHSCTRSRNASASTTCTRPTRVPA